MENYILIQVPGEQTPRLADLNGVLHDLQQVQVACVLINKYMVDMASNAALIDALQAAAVVRYCRSFGDAGRMTFSLTAEMVEQLPGELRQAHRDFCELRDRCVGRSADDRKSHIPNVYLSRDASGRPHQPTRLIVEHRGVAALSKESVRKLYELARTFRMRVHDEIEQEKVRLLTYMQQALGSGEAGGGTGNPADLPDERVLADVSLCDGGPLAQLS